MHGRIILEKRRPLYLGKGVFWGREGSIREGIGQLLQSEVFSKLDPISMARGIESIIVDETRDKRP